MLVKRLRMSYSPETAAEVLLLEELHGPLSQALADQEDTVREARAAVKEQPKRLKEALDEARKRRMLLAQLAGEASPEALEDVILARWVDPDGVLRKEEQAARLAVVSARGEVPDAEERAIRAREHAEAGAEELGEDNPDVVQARGQAEERERELDQVRWRVRKAQQQHEAKVEAIRAAVAAWRDGQKLDDEARAQALAALKASGYAKRLESSGVDL